jgi:hypothetical protein
MAIEKSLYAMPTGIPQDVDFEVDIEVSQVNDEEPVIEVEVGTAGFDANLADEMPEGDLQEVADDILDMIRIDKNSRKDWERTYKEGLELLGLRIDDRTEPWDGACGVYHPILSESVVKFQSETIIETFPPNGPVKTKIIGKVTREKEQAAARVKDDMNYELTEKMVEYRSEHERLLWSLPIAGSAFKKVYFDPVLGRPMAMFVPAEDIIVPYGASDLISATRIAHRMKKTPNQLRKLQVSGFYRDIDISEPSRETNELQEQKDEETGMSYSEDDRYLIYEVHIDYDLPGFEDDDGIALPYVITIVSSGEVLSIRRNYLEDDPAREKRLHFSHYNYIPGFGFYGFGLIHLVGGFAKSATSILRQLVDAGTLSNLPGGFKSKDLRVKGDDTPIAPGEWRDVDVTGVTIKDSIVPLPYKEPSRTLYELLGTIVTEGRKFASVADLKVGDMSNQAPVGTTLAILERALKVMSAVQARVHAAMKIEFKLISALVRDYTPSVYLYEVDGPQRAKQSDYDTTEIIPVSDPNASTMAQRVVQYQAALQLAQSAPQLYDLGELHRQMLEVLGIRNVDKILPLTDDFKPKDPVSENMDIMTGKPAKAFMYQDHTAHIQVHSTAAQDPKIQQIIGQSPNAGAIQGALMAHIAEHVAFQYRIEIERMMGVPLPHPDEELPEDIEVELSRAVAMASAKLLQKDQAEAQMMQNKALQEDPVVQMQQKEVAIKEAEVQRKAQKDQIDAALKAENMRLVDERDRMRIQSQEEIAGAQIGAKIGDAEMKQETEGAKLGAKIAADRLPPR